MTDIQMCLWHFRFAIADAAVCLRDLIPIITVTYEYSCLGYPFGLRVAGALQLWSTRRAARQGLRFVAGRFVAGSGELCLVRLRIV